MTGRPAKTSLFIGAAWGLLSQLVLIPVAVIAADRLLPWGGIAAFGWGPPLVGLVAGRVHRDAKIGLFAALAVFGFGAIAFCIMVVFAVRSLPGP